MGELSSWLDDQAGPEAARLLAETARQTIAEVQSRPGQPQHGTLSVDGRIGAADSSVSPTGEIRCTFSLGGTIAAMLFDAIVSGSPRGPEHDGHYRDDHRVLLNGQETTVDPPPEMHPGDELVIINLRPYARRIEHGLSSQAPDGVYELAVQQMRQSLAGVSDVTLDFEYRSAAGGDAKRGDIRYPAAVVTVR